MGITIIPKQDRWSMGSVHEWPPPFPMGSKTIVVQQLCGGQLACSSPTPHFPGFRWTLHLMPNTIELSHTSPFCHLILSYHVTELLSSLLVLYIFKTLMTFFGTLPYIKNKAPSPMREGVQCYIHFIISILFLVLFYFIHLASHLGINQTDLLDGREVGCQSWVLCTCGGIGFASCQ